MQKDYHSVSATETDTTETEHIARHWTAVWDKLRSNGWTPHSVRSDEKYRLMEPFLKRLPHGARIMDGGCGLGQWVLALDDAGFKTAGIDLSTETVAFLSQRFPGHSFAVGDIRSLPSSEGAFDAYLSWGTFEHFESGMDEPIREAYRVLKPGGYLFLTVPFQNIRHIIRGVPTVGEHALHRFYQWRFTRNELRQELEMRGFGVTHITPISMAEGVSRAVEHDLHIPRRSIAGKVLTKMLTVILPRVFVAHMLFVVAQKR